MEIFSNFIKISFKRRVILLNVQTSTVGNVAKISRLNLLIQHDLVKQLFAVVLNIHLILGKVVFAVLPKEPRIGEFVQNKSLIEVFGH